ncbi:MAG: hypothetical protein N3D12_05920 [Candidatus Methanomethyliaceae archaeon]|nr:hypothetical protein [Candidatus Methanomethyliaceae archaeon]
MARAHKRGSEALLAQATPITLILLTVALFSITSMLANNSIVLISKVRYDDFVLKRRIISTIHECIEWMFASDPGTSNTMIVNMPSGEITFTSESVIFEGVGLPELHDPHSIVKSMSPGKIVYDRSKLCLTPAYIPAGLSKVVFSVDMLGKVKKISIEVDKI